LSTLPSNPSIVSAHLQVLPQPSQPGTASSTSSKPSNLSQKVFVNPQAPTSYVLSYLDTTPPNPSLAIGTTTAVPPTPSSFQGNPRFLSILNDVLTKHAADDPELKGQAQAFASPGGFNFIQARNQRGSGSGAGGASGEGGAGGAGVGGWVHLSDSRAPPDFGRIAW
jgi:hypothetical protein